ncbi:methionine aminopeptidase, type I [Micromonospora pattaloongensis]|uniref:Methionine aminopeptidase n=1 Tax=Micromonospora pattaloongensis TaxID=405436 RepID=A0A1H3MK16_9ACTN|nr:type I methionyl aminopeptidase [Micromonospora pattaloongensis]SDY77021.1 methionine aminopeptidase, type I [Micromonospora pattaloongensis]
MRRQQLDIQLKTPEQIEKMRAAGLVVAAALSRMREAIAPGVTTADLDAIAESVIRDAGGVPSFKGYHGYPATICSSVNEQIVHAIPSPRQVLRDGDLISIDCGAVLDGWHGDSAITVGVGEVRPELLKMAAVADDAMWAGIEAAARGAASGRGRLTDISHAVETAVRKAGRYGIVEGYGGHGIGTEMHQDPHVLNYGRPGKGPRLVPGMALAIEPMITLGSPKSEELADGWTVVTRDGSIAAHVEHSIALLDDGVWVLTAADGGRGRLGDLVTARQPAGSAI